MKKHLYIIFIVALCISLLAIVVSAHPGRTDYNGGHYDHSTGEYHYHHGYPAHDHYDMDGDGDIDCPYKFNDKANHNSSSGKPQTKPSTNQQGADTEYAKEPTLGEIILIILKIIGISLIVFFLGWFIWAIINELIIVPVISWLCHKLSDSEVNEENIQVASYIVIIVLIITFATIGVLGSEGIL